MSGVQAACQCGSAGSRRSCKAQLPISISPSKARSHAVRPLPQDGPRGLPHHVSREAAVFEVMLTRGYSGTRAGAFIIPIPGAIARAMKRRPRCGPRPNGQAQRCPCPSYPGAGYELIEGHRCASTAASSSRSIFAAVGARQPTSRARVLEVRIQSPPAESPRLARFFPPTEKSRLFPRVCGPGRCSAVSRDQYRAVHGADRREYLCWAKFQYRGVDAAVA